jgi:hypothetical protein
MRAWHREHTLSYFAVIHRGVSLAAARLPGDLIVPLENGPDFPEFQAGGWPGLTPFAVTGAGFRAAITALSLRSRSTARASASWSWTCIA